MAAWPAAKTCLLVFSALIAAFSSLPLRAQSFPAKPVRLISGFPPGGGSDIVGRAIALKLGERWKQSFVVDNRPGAGGTLAMSITARSSPDGYTLMMLSGSQITNAALFARLAQDMTQALAPIAQVTTQAYLLVAPASFVVSNVPDLLKMARAQPEKIKFGSAGVGSVTHLGMELMSIVGGVRFTHIPYKGSGQVITDLIGSHIDLAFATSLSAMSHVQGGRLKALGITSRKRSDALPNLPTLAESGLPEYEMTGWYGIVTPAGTSAAVIDTLNQGINAALREEDVRRNLANDGAEPVGGTAAQFGSVMRNEVVRWKRVVDSRNIRID